MKKSFYLVIAFFVFAITNAQITISSDILGDLDKFKPETFKKFKSTTTIFVLSNVFQKEEYEKILKESWTVTPYKIVSINDFKYSDYLTDDYSFAHLRAFAFKQETTSYIYNIINFYLFDINEIKKKFDKVKDDPKDLKKLLMRNKISIVAIHLFANSEFTNKVLTDVLGEYTSEDMYIPTYLYCKDIVHDVYNKSIYQNYTLGMLQNYFQKVSSLISKEEFCDLRETDKTSEVKNLKKETLYIPDYNKIAFKPVKVKEISKSDENLKELFEDYKYKYSFISDKDLDTKIANGDNFYYLRYVKVNNRKFFHIVNGKTGEVIYRDYEAGLGTYNIDGNDFKKLAKEIAK